MISGASSRSGEERPDFLRFALMTMPHADDASGCAARSPDEYDEPRIQPADCNVARLAIIPPVIFPGQVRSGKDLLGPAHIETPLI